MTASFFVHDTLSPYKTVEEFWDGEIWYRHISEYSQWRRLYLCWIIQEIMYMFSKAELKRQGAYHLKKIIDESLIKSFGYCLALRICRPKLSRGD